MKLLLDECVDRRFAKELAWHEVKTVPQMGRATKKNGELLALAAAEFDVFITVDRNLSFQQNLPQFKIAVLSFTCAIKPAGGFEAARAENTFCSANSDERPSGRLKHLTVMRWIS